MFTAMFVIILVSLLFLLVFQTINACTYWKRKGVRGPRPIPFFGNMLDGFITKQSFGFVLNSYCQQYPSQNIIGMFKGTSPALLVRSPQIIQEILIKNFENFADRGFSSKSEEFNENLFSSDGDQWRVLRQRLSPVFTSGKLKNMYYLIMRSASNLESYVNKVIEQRSDPELRELTAKFTLDAVGSCAFGIDVDGFSEGDNVYRKVGDRIFALDLSSVIKRSVSFIFPSLFPVVKFFSSNDGVAPFFYKLVKDLTKERQSKPKTRHDFMDLLIEMKEQGEISGSKIHKDSKLSLNVTDSLIASQAIVFYGGGFETSSGTMAFLLHELALNQDIQTKVRGEVDRVLKNYNGELTYEAIKEMSYLEMVLSETLRKYPVVEFLTRKSIRECKIDGAKIEADTNIFIPLYPLHHDPNVFPEPEKFDPERFSSGNKTNIPPCAYMPFGDGPRNCIGMRFGQVMSKVGIATILRSFIVLKTERTKERLTFDPKSVTLASSDGIWVKFQKRTDVVLSPEQHVKAE